MDVCMCWCGLKGVGLHVFTAKKASKQPSKQTKSDSLANKSAKQNLGGQ